MTSTQEVFGRSHGMKHAVGFHVNILFFTSIQGLCLVGQQGLCQPGLGLARRPEADLDGVGICEVAAVVPHPVFPKPSSTFGRTASCMGICVDTRSSHLIEQKQIVSKVVHYAPPLSPHLSRCVRTDSAPTRGISAEGCAHTGHIALSPAFRALDMQDLRRGLRAHRPNRTLAYISRARHARSPQRVARTPA